MFSCAKCKGFRFFFASSGKDDADEMAWVCQECGYRETHVMRRRRRLVKRLCAVSILSTVMSVLALYVAPVVYLNFMLACECNPELRSTIFLIATGLASVIGSLWAWEQLRNGGFRSLRNELRGRPKAPRRGQRLADRNT
jgi:hypothetical protein